MAPMIEVQNLSKHFRDHVAVDDLTFSLEPGEILGFLGPNGAGKTTTMRMITGAMPPTEGSVRINGLDVFENPMEVRRKIGYLPEIPPVYMDMTVRSYIEFCGRIKGLSGTALRSEADRVMEATDVKNVGGRLICNLSKGYRQRVGLSQAILGSPSVLILDEPTVGLDPVQIIEVRSLIRSLAESGKHTIILSTHILHEVTELCGRILVIKNGRMVAFDTPDGLGKKMNNGKPSSLEETYLRLIEAADPSQAQKFCQAQSSDEGAKADDGAGGAVASSSVTSEKNKEDENSAAASEGNPSSAEVPAAGESETNNSETKAAD